MPHIQIQFRRDNSTSWTFSNPILASGELGLELDTQQFKIGNGHARWKDLPYGGIQGPPGPAGLVLPPQTPTPGQVLTYVGGLPSNIQWRNPLSSSTTSVIVKASTAPINFNFNSPSWPTIIPATFGSGFNAGGVDTDGFSLFLNSVYDMSNLPIITGTIAYWNTSLSQIIYMQMKFGNSSISNSACITVTPTTPVSVNNNGGPLRLTVSGITSNAFTGVGNISTNSPLNYAIVVYLQLMN